MFTQGCHFQSSYPNQMSCFGLMQSDSSEENLIQRMKLIIEKAAKEIVLVELDVRGVEVKLRQMNAMQKYMLDKTDLLRHALMRYFVGSTLSYSKAALDQVKEKMSQKLRDKTLTLSQSDKILSLSLWIDKEECAEATLFC